MNVKIIVLTSTGAESAPNGRRRAKNFMANCIFELLTRVVRDVCERCYEICLGLNECGLRRNELIYLS
jgi:hypothetical protein